MGIVKLEGFFKRKLPSAATDDENNNGDTSRARRDGSPLGDEEYLYIYHHYVVSSI
jgi:hypothetical protein